MENPPALLPTENYEAIEAAVMETARGRWFLAEYARRNRQADTRAILDAIDELSRQVDNHPVGSGELDLLRRINALAGFATRSRAALTIEVQGRETPLLRVALSMLAEIERKLQVLGGQEAEAEADFLSAAEPAPRHTEATARLVPNDAAEDELFAEPSAASSETSAASEPEALATAEPDGATETDFDLFVAEGETAATAPDALEGWAKDAEQTAPLTLAPEAETDLSVEAQATDARADDAMTPDAKDATDFARGEFAATTTELAAVEPDPEEEMAAAAADSPADDTAEDESFVSPPIARTIQEIDGEPRWVFARKPAPVPRIAEIDALSFEEKSVYFA